MMEWGLRWALVGVMAGMPSGCKKPRDASEPLAAAATPTVSPSGDFYHDLTPYGMTLKAPFSSLLPAGPSAASNNDHPFYKGVLELVPRPGDTIAIDGDVRIRGQASLDVCRFPKLEFRATALGASPASPFFHSATVKIGTHCAEGESLAPYGKLMGELAVYREAFAYSLMSLLGMPGPLARTARIRYVDSRLGQTVAEKQAFLLESIDGVAARLGTRVLRTKEPSFPRSYYQRFDRQQLALVHVFNVLIGNRDYDITVDGDLFTQNIYLLETANQAIFPVTYDFDLATMVTGKILHASSSVDVQARYVDPTDALSAQDLRDNGFPRLRRLVPKADLDRALGAVVAKRTAINQLVAAAPMDQEGRLKIMGRLRAFWYLANQALSPSAAPPTAVY